MIKIYATAIALLAILNSFSQPYGNSVLLNGSTDYIGITDNPAIKPSAVTVEAWIKVNSFSSVKGGTNPNLQPIIFKQRAVDRFFEGYSLFLVENTRSLGCVVTSTANQQKAVYSSIVLNANQWYHAAMTADKDSIRLYLNGVRQASTSTGFELNYGTRPLYIGRYAEVVFEGFFNGFIDDVRIWNAVRGDQDIASNYLKELTGSEANLVAYYNMNVSGRGAGIIVPNTSSITGATLNGTTAGSATTPIFTTNAILPVKLASIQVENKEGGNRIAWVTSSETGTLYFEIQHSSDGKNFTSIGRINSQNSSTGLKAYSFVHANPSAGSNFYKLKVVDADNRFEYSHILRSTFVLSTKPWIIYPNPVKDILTIQISNPVQFDELEILNKSGQILLKRAIRTSTQINIETASYPKGVYLVRLKGNTKDVVSQFVKQ